MPAPANLIHEVSITTGTGNFTTSAVNGKVRFSDSTYAFGTGGTTNVFDYFISNRDAAEWEIGTGHMSAAGTLVRDTVVFSSNANAAVSFTAGTKDVLNDITAARQYWSDATALTAVDTADKIPITDVSASNASKTATVAEFFKSLNTLTTKTTPDPTADYGVIYDAAGAAAKKFLLNTLVREKLAANRTYYVRTDGINSNTGLVNSSGGAFLTIQKALDVALGTLDLGGYNVTIQVGSGTYTGAISFASAQVGAGQIKIAGDTTTPSNVLISTTGANAITVDGAGCRLFFEGLKLTSSGVVAIVQAKSGGYIKTTGKNEFGNCGSGHRLYATNTGVIDAVAAEVISGTAAGAHYLADNNGVIYCQSATWTASGTAVQASFAQASSGGVIYAFSNTSSGTFTGSRFTASNCGVINTNAGGANYFPGNSAGTGTNPGASPYGSYS